MKKAVLIIIAIILVVLLYEANQRRRSVSLRPAGQGTPAPEFSLVDLDGKPLSLANYSGKVVLLDFWATWCGPCRKEIPHFVELQDRYREQGLQIVGVSMDDEAKPVREFYQQFKMNYPVALGNEKVAELYGGVLGLPVTFLIGRDGRIQKKYVGETDMSALEREIGALVQPK